MRLAANSPCTWWARSGVTAWNFLETFTVWLSFRGEFITFLTNKNFSNSGEDISEYHEESKTFITRWCMNITYLTVNSLDHFWIWVRKIIDVYGQQSANNLSGLQSPSCLCLCLLLHFWLHSSTVSRQKCRRGLLIPFLSLAHKTTCPPALHRGTAHRGGPRMCEEARFWAWNKNSRQVEEKI